MFNVLAHLDNKQPYTCDECGVGFSFDDYERNSYCCKKNVRWTETWYKQKHGSDEYRCMIKTGQSKPKGNPTYHYCFDCADVKQ
ncbi:MAG: hypothetical protein GY861_18735 [bacterium]|jgi:hypothetical protein|nr:hypothetical protein [bacterium]